MGDHKNQQPAKRNYLAILLASQNSKLPPFPSYRSGGFAA